ncbi:hypothetical protein KVV02_000831 [Mortierella alpina]|uniref:FAD-binding domain-containing protein n=1 Tax=Mortierella alpina TaxID=64518 RepID=A0A9P8A3R2_MORAP|nr:hypothetical protein KVV02_000831 [Mortierella alpina]
MTTTAQTGPKVLIVGAGLGGVTLAILLEKAGVPYEVFERATTVKPLGSAMHIGPKLHPLFEQIGVYDEFVALSKHLIDVRGHNEKREFQRSLDFTTAEAICTCIVGQTGPLDPEEFPQLKNPICEFFSTLGDNKPYSDEITQVFTEYRAERYPIVREAFVSSQMLSWTIDRGFKGTLARLVARNLPYWLWKKFLVKGAKERPQVGFLPERKNMGTVPADVQPSFLRAQEARKMALAV